MLYIDLYSISAVYRVWIQIIDQSILMLFLITQFTWVITKLLCHTIDNTYTLYYLYITYRGAGKHDVAHY